MEFDPHNIPELQKLEMDILGLRGLIKEKAELVWILSDWAKCKAAYADMALAFVSLGSMENKYNTLREAR